MIFYKYKSTEFIEDVIVNQRIYSSSFKNLNDPMEWAFTSDSDKREVQELIEETDKDSWRICCLSQSIQYGLMWSMYGDSHKGVCVEVEVDIDKVSENLQVKDFGVNKKEWLFGAIRYRDDPDNLEDIDRNDITRALWVKSKQWKQEQEVRFVRRLEDEDSVYFPVKVKALYLGKRIDPEKALYIEKLCRYAGISCICMNSDSAPKINYWNDCNNSSLKNLNNHAASETP